jgi:DNA-binding winged helix-turn-helix (wHTH) protein
VVTFGPFEFDLSLRRLTKDGEQIALTTGEFSMLKALVRHPRQPLSRDKLAQLARGREFEPFDRSLDVQISRLRKMIEPDPAQPRYIQTVWGVGYVFVPDGAAELTRRSGAFPRGALTDPEKAGKVALSLFWRTFFLLALLLAGGIFAWVQTLRALEFEPRAVQAAQQIASLVNLSRAALRHSDGINRVALVKTMGRARGGARGTARARRPWEPFEVDRFTRRVAASCAPASGPDTIVASSVNGSPACGWASRSSATATGCRPRPPASMPLSGEHLGRVGGHRAAGHADRLGAIARLINRPLRSCRSRPAASAAASSTHAWTRTP